MFEIAFNESALNRTLAQAESEIRFAASMALTTTAKDAQAEVRKQLPQRFMIRTGWVAKGIHVRAANKRDLQSSVRVLDPFMALQESGGSKIGQFGKDLGVPVGARPTPTAITRPGSFPGAMLQRKGHFIAPIRKGSNVKGVWRRTGKGRRERIKLMYVFSRQVRLKPRFGFHETVRQVALQNFPRRFAEAVQKVLTTARVR
ncbi:MAG: hypothetical protein HQM03_15050 [Magnetococcales bacterium]|nr:hypothetical protein [Magnetococcales bacterium]